MEENDPATGPVERWRDRLDAFEADLAPGGALWELPAPQLAYAQAAHDAARGVVARFAREREPAPTRAERDALFRIGLCAELARWAPRGALPDRLRATSGLRPADKVDLVSVLAGLPLVVPPGIALALDYARTPHAACFVQEQLVPLLRRVAEFHAVDGIDLRPLLADLRLDGTAAGVQRVGRIWSTTACLVYLDWLCADRHAGLEQARREVWRFGPKQAPVQFRAPSGQAALPTADRHIVLDLWTDRLAAWIFDPAPSGCATSSSPWWPVRLAMRDFSAQANHSRDGDDWRRRGLSIGMVYQLLVTDAMATLPHPGASAGDACVVEPSPDGVASFMLALPECRPGQRLTVRVVVEWAADRDTGPKAPMRLHDAAGQPFDGPALQAAEQAWRDWQRRERGARAERDRHEGVECLNPGRVGFEDAAVGALTDDGADLIGSITLADAALGDPLWIDVLAFVLRDGRMHELDLQPVDWVVDGAARTGLAIARSAWPRLAAARVSVDDLRYALGDGARSCWAWRREGLGAFLAIGADLDGA